MTGQASHCISFEKFRKSNFITVSRTDKLNRHWGKRKNHPQCHVNRYYSFPDNHPTLDQNQKYSVPEDCVGTKSDA